MEWLKTTLGEEAYTLWLRVMSQNLGYIDDHK